MDSPDGFRSREDEVKRRQEIRKKILQGFGGKQRSESKLEKKEKYVGLAKTLEIQKDQSNDSNQIDMFGDDDHGEDQKVNLKEIETTDESGYYNIVTGKVLFGGKYKIVEKIGKGVFGIVAKVETEENGCKKDYAVKIIRKNPLMEASGESQYKIISSLKKPEYIVPVFDYFHEDGHLFIVCQLMGPDLRSFSDKNQDKITLSTIRQFAISMFMCLHQLRKNKVIHADIKSDNFLFTPNLKTLKLTDFGTAYAVQEHNHEIDELVARYYRAPEIILGCELNSDQRYSIDTWAVGCCLFEIFTGKFLFQGGDNCQMLKLIMETKGKFNQKMLKKCTYSEKYFNQEGSFLHNYYDKNSKSMVTKKIHVTITPERELLNMLKKMSKFDEQIKNLLNFKDFLEHCLNLNPKNRLNPEQAFKHPFLNHMVKLT